jgi:hypothetical protein
MASKECILMNQSLLSYDFLFMPSCILYENAYILIILYLYVCLWNMKMQNNNKLINKTFEINQLQYPLKVMKI